jgi:hypothetical protein
MAQRQLTWILQCRHICVVAGKRTEYVVQRCAVLVGGVLTDCGAAFCAVRGDSSSSESSDGDVSSDSSSEDADFPDRGSVGRARADESSDEDSDEPPEIPGSPIAQVGLD